MRMCTSLCKLIESGGKHYLFSFIFKKVNISSKHSFEAATFSGGNRTKPSLLSVSATIEFHNIIDYLRGAPGKSRTIASAPDICHFKPIINVSSSKQSSVPQVKSAGGRLRPVRSL